MTTLPNKSIYSILYQLNYFKMHFTELEKKIANFIFKNKMSGTWKQPGKKDVKEVDSVVSHIIYIIG